MKVEFGKKFLKELKKLPPKVKKSVVDLLIDLENYEEIEDVPNIVKLEGYKCFYRIRVGGWRIGLKYEDSEIKVCYIITIQPRGDIYKKLP
jgi:mRNA interferase RelE/StbE